MNPRKNFFSAQTVWLAVLDALCLGLAVVIAAFVRFFDDPEYVGAYLSGDVQGWVYFCGSIILANYIVGSYGICITTSRFNLFVNWLFSLAFALFILSITSYAWFEQLLGRGVLAIALLTYGILTLVVKSVVYGIVFRSSFFVYRVAVIGTGERARKIQEVIEARHVLPSHRVSAYLRVAQEGTEERSARSTINGVAVIDASPAVLEEIVRSLGADIVVVALSDRAEARKQYSILRRLRFSGTEVLDSLSVAEVYSGRIPLDLIDEAWLMQASLEPSLAVVRRFKRIFDLVCVLGTSLVAVPIAVGVAAVLKVTAPFSPVIYTQERVGQFGKLFRIYKFRTMKDNAEEDGIAVWSAEGDPRITRLGALLRKFRFDEIPQLWNILIGDMSFVGPRPERPEIVARLEEEISFYRERQNVPPGLTGWAQVQYPYTDNVEDSARKLEYDLFYTKNLSLGLDLQVFLRTLRIVLLGKERVI